jgi:branched-chain amino acid transport system substrate-binding protein
VQALQVILSAIAKSDGTRKGVRAQVFSGAGISIPASVSMVGRELAIDPTTGDTKLLDMTIEVVRNNQEEHHKAWPVR